jgi:hypothetical protein
VSTTAVVNLPPVLVSFTLEVLLEYQISAQIFEGKKLKFSYWDFQVPWGK